jgi:Cupredoxin-like domain
MGSRRDLYDFRSRFSPARASRWHGRHGTKTGKEKVVAPMTDQERFDQEVATKGKVVLQVLAGVGVFAAVLMSMVALVQTSAPRTIVETVKPAAATVAAAAAVPTEAAKVVNLKVIPEGKKGPEGTLHDDFTVTEFNVKVGKPVTLRIDNTDNTAHSITSAEAGVNIVVQPGTHDYTLKVSKAGKFEWNCAYPCDPWSMAHTGYMAGYITAT